MEMNRDLMKLYLIDLFSAAEAATLCNPGQPSCDKCMADLRTVVAKINDERRLHGTSEG